LRPSGVAGTRREYVPVGLRSASMPHTVPATPEGRNGLAFSFFRKPEAHKKRNARPSQLFALPGTFGARGEASVLRSTASRAAERPAGPDPEGAERSYRDVLVRVPGRASNCASRDAHCGTSSTSTENKKGVHWTPFQIGAEGRTRTGTGYAHYPLKIACLPISPLRLRAYSTTGTSEAGDSTSTCGTSAALSSITGTPASSSGTSCWIFSSAGKRSASDSTS
jgi:hypothetical protein